eukprot:3111229-Heterocapsa_arctica.AAC.1
MFVASPMVIAGALSERQKTSKHDSDRKEAKYNPIVYSSSNPDSIICCVIGGERRSELLELTATGSRSSGSR